MSEPPRPVPDGGPPDPDPAARPHTALVLAGQRGPSDPLAASQGLRHRALLEVGGVPMLLRVVSTLRSCPGIGRIVVSIGEPEALDAVADLREAVARGEIQVHRSLPSPSRSVLDVLEGIAAGERVLVTTADHALLAPPMVERMIDPAADAADVRVGVVAASRVRAAYPETTRTYLRLRGSAWSGANLFAFRSDAARRAAAFWVRAERHRKRPWRLVGAFGAGTLLQFALRRLDLDAAMQRVSRAMGAEVRAVPLPWAEAAIDVDRHSDLALVKRILRDRRSGTQSATTPSSRNRPVAGS